MYKKQKQYLIIAILVLLLVGIIYLISNYKIDEINDDKQFDISFYKVEEFTKRNIDNREILKVDKNLLIGYSKKELENGYYDLKIYEENDTLFMHLNKVWKEFNDKLYEEKYVEQIVNSILNVFELNSKNAQKEIYEYIIEGYKVSKGLIDNNLSNEKGLKIESIEVKRKIVNSELILSVSKEVGK